MRLICFWVIPSSPLTNSSPSTAPFSSAVICIHLSNLLKYRQIVHPVYSVYFSLSTYVKQLRRSLQSESEKEKQPTDERRRTVFDPSNILVYRSYVLLLKLFFLVSLFLKVDKMIGVSKYSDTLEAYHK